MPGLKSSQRKKRWWAEENSKIHRRMDLQEPLMAKLWAMWLKKKRAGARAGSKFQRAFSTRAKSLESNLISLSEPYPEVINYGPVPKF